MQAIRYRIKSINPLIISSKRGDANMVNTKYYIPGNNVLGVFASLYIKDKSLKNAHNDINFYNWFLKGDLIFSNAYIADGKRRYFPNPHSIKGEKYIGNPVYDLMFDNDDSDRQTKSRETFIAIKDPDIYSKPIKKSISFHHARENGMAKKGVIFNYESLLEDQIFEGNIIGENDQLNKFEEIFPEKFTAYVGLSKNSQYGKVEIELMKIPKLMKIPNYTSEVLASVESDDVDVVMTLLADSVIYNENGFSTTNVNDIEKLIGVRIRNSFIRQDMLEQFVGIWKLKNQSETVFTAGSCFELESLPDNYEELQINGIGEKTNEGFGRVVFGWQSGNFKYSKQSDMVTPVKPEGDPPEIVTKIAMQIIKDRLKDKVLSKAMQKAHSFNSLPTRSLCGKLQSFADNIDNFQSSLGKIVDNKPAKDQLEKCNDGGAIRLLKYLQQDKFIDINSMLNEIDNLDEFTNSLKNYNSLAIDMKRLYLKTFFNFMRKDERRKK